MRFGFSVLRFYPVCPGADEYAVGCLCSERLPFTSKTTIQSKSTPRETASNRYAGEMHLGGKPLERPFINYSEIDKGTKVRFEMQPEPGK